ncbi:hypothetical protein SSYRP_v1c00500 [Spiroplasma syrphidicola EA-1]|uniref:Single-stranded DNA-binding protein n=1 Tax=Spiroplasma syrphidicola EA-1 TaxID=1276229 RepID=R4UK54_9MOLU|nr:hypothetical protein [Spiroplasma syrphidicola]AGM25646.1 hypothetical protein SSYRP_v1c00500 [Spiroplasma syrphidicola EA-1]
MNLVMIKGKVVSLSDIKIDKKGKKFYHGELWSNSISFDGRNENVKVNFCVWQNENINFINYKEKYLDKIVYLIGYLKSIGTNMFIVDTIFSLQDFENKNEQEEISNLVWRVLG